MPPRHTRSRSPRSSAQQLLDSGTRLLKAAESAADEVGGYEADCENHCWPWKSREFTSTETGFKIKVKTDGVVSVTTISGKITRTFWPIEADQIKDVFENPEVDLDRRVGQGREKISKSHKKGHWTIQESWIVPAV
eukprot:gnl/TRDRNA2_/TRDRNA2_197482_c0_seq1.p3 gnl/TRDRNA2_/TRDRNA2_197482_c0~~gnl/TRDRNA2_/TRDRNA2_197482_c0_seq1.p3  ORF type:complete len:136 (+),score=12.74 gnl/TRDRNA2_/TRDRNA2_197482_c0_seq1:70-477(+)